MYIPWAWEMLSRGRRIRGYFTINNKFMEIALHGNIQNRPGFGYCHAKMGHPSQGMDEEFCLIFLNIHWKSCVGFPTDRFSWNVDVFKSKNNMNKWIGLLFTHWKSCYIFLRKEFTFLWKLFHTFQNYMVMFFFQ